MLGKQPCLVVVNQKVGIIIIISSLFFQLGLDKTGLFVKWPFPHSPGAAAAKSTAATLRRWHYFFCVRSSGASVIGRFLAWGIPI